jgi:hypothetical protein
LGSWCLWDRNVAHSQRLSRLPKCPFRVDAVDKVGDWGVTADRVDR